MFKWLGIIFGTVGAAMRCRHDLATENLALRQQLAVMKYQCPRPRLTNTDRFFRVLLSQIWSDWHAALHIVKPETVVRGTDKVFATTGAGKAVTEVVRRPTPKSES